MFALTLVNPTTILIITAVLLLLLGAACILVRRTDDTSAAELARERAKRVPVSRPAQIDVWSSVPYEPEAFNRQLDPQQVKPPARKPWRAHPEISAAEQARIEARVQDRQSEFLGRAVVREVHLSDTEFGQLFPAK